MSYIQHTVPKRYATASFNPKTTSQVNLLNNLRAKSNDLIVVGGVGVGKTHIVCGYINYLVQKEIYAKYITEYSFIDLFTLRHSSDTDTAREAEKVIYHTKHYHTLIIDEIGKRELSKKQNIELDELISARYDNMLRTILVSNLTIEEIKDRVKDRAFDRLRGNKAELIVLDGNSLRGEY